MRRGGESDPGNKGLMKMFNLINIGERAGSGVPDIFHTWEQEAILKELVDDGMLATSGGTKKKLYYLPE